MYQQRKSCRSKNGSNLRRRPKICFTMVRTYNSYNYSHSKKVFSQFITFSHILAWLLFVGYDAYMDNAFPADELMPLSCQGRYRGVQPDRGDLDDALGNFSLTLIDSLDMLVVVGDLPGMINDAIFLLSPQRQRILSDEDNFEEPSQQLSKP